MEVHWMSSALIRSTCWDCPREGKGKEQGGDFRTGSLCCSQVNQEMVGLSSSIQPRPKAAAFQLVTNKQDTREVINWVPRIKASICNLASAGSSPQSLLPKHIAPSCPHVTNGKMQGEKVLQLCRCLGLRSLRERAPFNSALPLVPVDISELLNPSWPWFLQKEL